LFDDGEIFEIYMKIIFEDSPVVSVIINLMIVLKGLKMLMENLQINWCSEGESCRILIELFLRRQVFCDVILSQMHVF
jgi:hypothetical protein